MSQEADAEKLTSGSPKAAQISLEILQRISFELISKNVLLWRTYKDTDQGKGQKIMTGARIHEMVIQAMRFHPDIKTLKSLADLADELEKGQQEIEEDIVAARKVKRTTTKAAKE